MRPLLYDSVLRHILDTHAPLISREITCRPNAPWYNEELRRVKQELRRLERKKRSSGLEVDAQNVKNCRNRYNYLLRDAKSMYHIDQFKDCDTRDLFKKMDKLCNPHNTTVLPSCDTNELLAKRFSRFFAEKIDRIVDKLQTMHSSFDDPHVERTCAVTFERFLSVSVQQVIKIITNSPSSTCAFDPIPTCLLKRCKEELAPIIARVINMSFEQGVYPDVFKYAHVKPLLKNNKLDAEDMKNYRPIANLKFLSKTVERAAALQIQSYTKENNLNATMQSAYRRNHSVETALLGVSNDLLLTIDKGLEAILLRWIILQHSTRYVMTPYSVGFISDLVFVALHVGGLNLTSLVALSLSSSKGRHQPAACFDVGFHRAQCWAPFCSLCIHHQWKI